MVVVPPSPFVDAIAVIAPVVAFIVPTAVLELLQVPPVTLSVNVVEKEGHMAAVPLMAADVPFAVTTVVACALPQLFVTT